MLSLALALPSPALALRPGSAIDDPQSSVRAGLEDALGQPAAGMEEGPREIGALISEVFERGQWVLDLRPNESTGEVRYAAGRYSLTLEWRARTQGRGRGFGNRIFLQIRLGRTDGKRMTPREIKAVQKYGFSLADPTGGENRFRPLYIQPPEWNQDTGEEIDPGGRHMELAYQWEFPRRRAGIPNQLILQVSPPARAAGRAAEPLRFADADALRKEGGIFQGPPANAHGVVLELIRAGTIQALEVEMTNPRVTRLINQKGAPLDRYIELRVQLKAAELEQEDLQFERQGRTLRISPITAGMEEVTTWEDFLQGLLEAMNPEVAERNPKAAEWGMRLGAKGWQEIPYALLDWMGERGIRLIAYDAAEIRLRRGDRGYEVSLGDAEVRPGALTRKEIPGGNLAAVVGIDPASGGLTGQRLSRSLSRSAWTEAVPRARLAARRGKQGVLITDLDPARGLFVAQREFRTLGLVDQALKPGPLPYSDLSRKGVHANLLVKGVHLLTRAGGLFKQEYVAVRPGGEVTIPVTQIKSAGGLILRPGLGAARNELWIKPAPTEDDAWVLTNDADRVLAQVRLGGPREVTIGREPSGDNVIRFSRDDQISRMNSAVSVRAAEKGPPLLVIRDGHAGEPSRNGTLVRFADAGLEEKDREDNIERLQARLRAAADRQDWEEMTRLARANHDAALGALALAVVPGERHWESDPAVGHLAHAIAERYDVTRQYKKMISDLFKGREGADIPVAPLASAEQISRAMRIVVRESFAEGETVPPRILEAAGRGTPAPDEALDALGVGAYLLSAAVDLALLEGADLEESKVRLQEGRLMGRAYLPSASNSLARYAKDLFTSIQADSSTYRFWKPAIVARAQSDAGLEEGEPPKDFNELSAWRREQARTPEIARRIGEWLGQLGDPAFIEFDALFAFAGENGLDVEVLKEAMFNAGYEPGSLGAGVASKLGWRKVAPLPPLAPGVAEGLQAWLAQKNHPASVDTQAIYSVHAREAGLTPDQFMDALIRAGYSSRYVEEVGKPLRGVWEKKAAGLEEGREEAGAGPWAELPSRELGRLVGRLRSRNAGVRRRARREFESVYRSNYRRVALDTYARARFFFGELARVDFPLTPEDFCRQAELLVRETLVEAGGRRRRMTPRAFHKAVYHRVYYGLRRWTGGMWGLDRTTCADCLVQVEEAAGSLGLDLARDGPASRGEMVRQLRRQLEPAARREFLRAVARARRAVSNAGDGVERPGGRMLDVQDPSAREPRLGLLFREEAAHVRKRMPSLSNLEQRVVNLRYGLEDGLPRSLEQVGEIVGMTGGGVWRVEKRALAKLSAEGDPEREAAIRQAVVEARLKSNLERLWEEGSRWTIRATSAVGFSPTQAARHGEVLRALRPFLPAEVRQRMFVLASTPEEAESWRSQGLFSSHECPEVAEWLIQLAGDVYAEYYYSSEEWSALRQALRVRGGTRVSLARRRVFSRKDMVFLRSLLSDLSGIPLSMMSDELVRQVDRDLTVLIQA